MGGGITIGIVDIDAGYKFKEMWHYWIAGAAQNLFGSLEQK